MLQALVAQLYADANPLPRKQLGLDGPSTKDRPSTCPSAVLNEMAVISVRAPLVWRMNDDSSRF
jgi:hypothetical protein